MNLKHFSFTTKSVFCLQFFSKQRLRRPIKCDPTTYKANLTLMTLFWRRNVDISSGRARQPSNIFGWSRKHCCHAIYTGLKLQTREVPSWLFNLPSPWWRPPVYEINTVFLWKQVGLTYEESAVKLVVRVLKSGTVFYKTHAHKTLLNVTFLCLSFNLRYLRYERRRVVKFGVFLYLSCITYA